MSTQIKIEIRSVYGNLTAYPIDDNAKEFARIAGTKTITAATLAGALRLGFSVIEVDRRGHAAHVYQAKQGGADYSYPAWIKELAA